jgi:rsbT antagonist protein RsbS
MQQIMGASGPAMNIIENVLMVQAPGSFDDASFRALRLGVLEKVHANSVRGVLLDVSAIEVIDSVSFNLLTDTARTVTMLGARVVFVGFQPGVVSALIDLGVEFEGIEAARELSDAMDILRPPLPKCEEVEDEEEVETGSDEEMDDGNKSEMETEEEMVEQGDGSETN